MKADALADLPRSRRYLVAVSGGRDSIALLHWLLAQGYRTEGRSYTVGVRYSFD